MDLRGIFSDVPEWIVTRGGWFLLGFVVGLAAGWLFAWIAYGRKIDSALTRVEDWHNQRTSNDRINNVPTTPAVPAMPIQPGEPPVGPPGC